jgi:hypothetical protein
LEEEDDGEGAAVASAAATAAPSASRRSSRRSMSSEKWSRWTLLSWGGIGRADARRGVLAIRSDAESRGRGGEDWRRGSTYLAVEAAVDGAGEVAHGAYGNDDDTERRERLEPGHGGGKLAWWGVWARVPGPSAHDESEASSKGRASRWLFTIAETLRSCGVTGTLPFCEKTIVLFLFYDLFYALF